MTLNLYALRDSKSGLYYSPATGFDDKHTIKYYNGMAVSLLNENKEDHIKNKILDTQIFKLGEINLETGELTNDNNFLCNLVNLEDLVEENEKDGI